MKLKLLGILFLSFNLPFIYGSDDSLTEDQKKLHKDLELFRQSLPSRSCIEISFSYYDNNQPVTELDKALTAIYISNQKEFFNKLKRCQPEQTKVKIIIQRLSDGRIKRILISSDDNSSVQ